jgi:tRNA(Ile)-lysidine synthase
MNDRMNDQMDDMALQSEVAAVPAGGWAVGVSGGADSVALLWLLRGRDDLRLCAAHLDHQTRGGESAADAHFVQDLCGAWRVECVTARREQIERDMPGLEGNLSARYRAARLAFFKEVVAAGGLRGVILAHHADDQAETILHRLCRGAGPAGLIGMRRETSLGGLVVVRPLLGIPGVALRALLERHGQAWREDVSNASPKYVRNRLRRLLRDRAALAASLRELGGACGTLEQWVWTNAPPLEERFAAADLAGWPAILAQAAARRWLAARGAPPQDVGPAAVCRLVAMAGDAGTPARQDFPGGLPVRRRAGVIFVERRIGSLSPYSGRGSG